MKDISLKEMLDNAVHFGHRTHRWNPKMKQYIFCKRKGIHVFDLHQTAEKLKEALEFLRKSAAEGRSILLVATKQHAAKLLEEVAQKTRSPYVTQKWICGLLTNFSTIKTRIKYFKKLQELFATGEIEKYKKKEQLAFKKEIDKLQIRLGGVVEMTKPPDVVVVIDCVKDRAAVNEAKRLGIKVVGIVDTCADPEHIDYLIPANDDAVKSLTYLINFIGEAILEGKHGGKKQ
jgi:small subunit ribosomal protein S2